jgi:hypothetical protein
VVVPIGTRGGQLLVTCSATGISDLRAITGAGWSGYWAVTAKGVVTLWFTRGDETRVTVVSCVAGVPSIQEGRLRRR